MAEKQSTLMPTSTAISSSSTKHNKFEQVFLHEWWLVNAKGKGGSSGGLAVGGLAHRDDAVVLIYRHGGECRICHWIIWSTQRVSLFCSAPISKRLDATAVLARDGIAISLNGLINIQHTTNNGYSMEVCNKFMVGFPYDWDDYATYHAHQSCGAHADVLDKSECYSNTEKNVTYRSSLEGVPVTSIRDMPKRNDLKNLMDDILAKAGSPKENDEPPAKFVAKRCLKASPVIDVAGYNHDQVRNEEDGTVTPLKKEQNTCLHGEEAVCSPNQAGVCKRSAKRCLKASPGKVEAGYNHNLLQTASSKKRSRCSQPEAVNCHDRMANSARNTRSVSKSSLIKGMAGQDQDWLVNTDCVIVTPSKKDQNTCLQGEKAVCSPNQAGLCKRSAKICLKASPGKDEAGYNHNQLETASSKKRSRCSQPEEAINCHDRMANYARNTRSVSKASLIKGMAGQDQDWLVDTDCEMVTPTKKDQSSCYQLEETIFDSHYQTSISPSRIKSCLRASMGIDATGRKHNRLHDNNVDIGTSSSKGQGRSLQLDSAVNPHSRTGVSTRSMTRLKKYND